MLLNHLLFCTQKLFKYLYDKSFVLKNIDFLIFISIILLIISSAFLYSDTIGNFAFITIFLTVVKLLVRPNEKISLSQNEIFLIIYFLIVLISVAGSSLLLLSLKGFSKTLIYLGFYFSFVNYIKNNKNMIKWIFIAIAFVSLIESFFAFSQNFMSVSEISGWQDMSRLNPEEIMTRVYGTVKPYNPNLFGGYMLSILPVNLFLTVLPFFNKHYKTSIFGLFSFVMCMISVVLTGCRGAYIGLFFELLFLIFITYKFLAPKLKKMFTYLIGILGFAVTIFILSITSLRARIFSIFAMRSDSSNSFRFNVYNSCIQMFKDNWLLGIGVGNQNFREIYGLYMKTGFDALSAYNIYLEIAVESGIFALLAFLSFVIINIKNAINYIIKKRNISVLYLVISVMSLIGILLHGFVDTVFFRPQIQFIFWIMIGIIRVLVQGTSRSFGYAGKRN